MKHFIFLLRRLSGDVLGFCAFCFKVITKTISRSTYIQYVNPIDGVILPYSYHMS